MYTLLRNKFLSENCILVISHFRCISNTSKVVPAARNNDTVETFLNKIGRGCAEYKEKFSSWEDLMTISSQAIKALEIPVTKRRWILSWAEKYRQGIDPYLIPESTKVSLNQSKKRGSRKASAQSTNTKK